MYVSHSFRSSTAASSISASFFFRFAFSVAHFARAFFAAASGFFITSSSFGSNTGSSSSPAHCDDPFSMFSMSLISFWTSVLMAVNDFSAFFAVSCSSLSCAFHASRSWPSCHFTRLYTFTLLRAANSISFW